MTIQLFEFLLSIRARLPGVSLQIASLFFPCLILYKKPKSKPLLYQLANQKANNQSPILKTALANTVLFFLLCLFRSRRDGRSSNGTLTFRRPSAAPQNQTPQSVTAPDNTMQFPTADSTSTPQAAPVPTDLSAARYSKEHLLGLYRDGVGTASQGSISRLYMDGWNPGAGQLNGHSSRGWGKPQEPQPVQDPDVCWNSAADMRPLGLQEMSLEEKEVRRCYPCLRLFFIPFFRVLILIFLPDVPVRCQLSDETPSAEQGCQPDGRPQRPKGIPISGQRTSLQRHVADLGKAGNSPTRIRRTESVLSFHRVPDRWHGPIHEG